MTHRIERLGLPAAGPGTRRDLLVHRFGVPGARPKAYLQASIHADEPPGMLVLHHLLRRLIAADAAGRVTGELVILPYANPIGLVQWVNGRHLGRFELGGGGNFNRGYATLADAATERVADRLGDDPAANTAMIRSALDSALAERVAESELGALRLALLRLSMDADIVLDLHCDDEALLHLYLPSRLWPALADLSAQLGSAATLLADSSGGEPFDEAHSLPWIELERRFCGRHPVPLACQAATVELRGRSDVDDAAAERDADNLYRFLVRRGLLAGEPGPLPRPLCDATPFAGTDIVKAPIPGVIAYRCALGAHVAAGEIVAEIVDPSAEDPGRARTPVAARTDGLLFTRVRDRYARPGMEIAKIAGATPLAHRTGKLLED